MTHSEFIERVRQIYGSSVEIISEYHGLLYDVDFIYKCKHGETQHSTKAVNLLRNKACYCFRCKYPIRDKIYVGAKFGDWEVIDDSYSDNMCRCRCKCGTEKNVDNYSLITGTSSGCGCYRKTQEYADKMSKISKKYNDYVVCNNCVIMYTTKNEPFIVDIEDFGRVKKICWSKNNSGYLTGNAGNNQIVMLHRYIMNCPKGYDVDHIHGSETKFDNRRSNLRICTRAENVRNTKTPVTNTSGHKGVYWNKKRKRWVAQISYGLNPKNGKPKTHYLGSYVNIENAIKAREEAEEKYFGEFSYNNSRKGA